MSMVFLPCSNWKTVLACSSRASASGSAAGQGQVRAELGTGECLHHLPTGLRPREVRRRPLPRVCTCIWAGLARAPFRLFLKLTVRFSGQGLGPEALQRALCAPSFSFPGFGWALGVGDGSPSTCWAHSLCVLLHLLWVPSSWGSSENCLPLTRPPGGPP